MPRCLIDVRARRKNLGNCPALAPSLDASWKIYVKLQKEADHRLLLIAQENEPGVYIGWHNTTFIILASLIKVGSYVYQSILDEFFANPIPTNLSHAFPFTNSLPRHPHPKLLRFLSRFWCICCFKFFGQSLGGFSTKGTSQPRQKSPEGFTARSGVS